MIKWAIIVYKSSPTAVRQLAAPVHKHSCKNTEKSKTPWDKQSEQRRAALFGKVSSFHTDHPRLSLAVLVTLYCF